MLPANNVTMQNKINSFEPDCTFTKQYVHNMSRYITSTKQYVP